MAGEQASLVCFSPAEDSNAGPVVNQKRTRRAIQDPNAWCLRSPAGIRWASQTQEGTMVDREVLVQSDVADLQGYSPCWQGCYKSRPLLTSLARLLPLARHVSPLARLPPPAAAAARQVGGGWGARGAQGWGAGVLCIQACDGHCGL